MLISDLKPAKVINQLSAEHLLRTQTYSDLAEKTGISIFRSLFIEAAAYSNECIEELQRELHKLGGAAAPVKNEKQAQSISYLNSALNENSQEFLLNACYYESELMRDEYFQCLLLDDEHITTQHHLIFLRHYAGLKIWQEKVINLLAVLRNNLN
jgi:hypothetical protein